MPCWWRAGSLRPSPRPLPHTYSGVRPPSPSSRVRGPVRGKLLSGRGACQNRLPVLGVLAWEDYSPGSSRPGHPTPPGYGVVRSLWEQARRERGYLSLDSDSRLLSFLVSWYEANAGGGTACIPMTRPAIGDETGVCSRTVNRGVRALRERGSPRHPEWKKFSSAITQYLRLRAELERRLGSTAGATLMEGFSCFIPTAPFATLTSQALTHEQKLMSLAKEAENAFDVLDIPPRTRHFFETGAINDSSSRGTPLPPPVHPARLRSVRPAGQRLPPPAAALRIWTSCSFPLMTLYRHVPSITNFPVYRAIWTPSSTPSWTAGATREARRKLRLFPQPSGPHHHRLLLPCHLGPAATRAGRLLLEVLSEVQNTVPNFTLKYDPEVTPDAFAEAAIRCSPACSTRPCAAIPPTGTPLTTTACRAVTTSCPSGAAYTPHPGHPHPPGGRRRGVEHFVEELLPGVPAPDDRLHERAHPLPGGAVRLLPSSFLVQGGPYLRRPPSAHVRRHRSGRGGQPPAPGPGLVYGREGEADALGVRIMEKIDAVVKTLPAAHSPDREPLPAPRPGGPGPRRGHHLRRAYPRGSEPESFADHLRHCARFHPLFPRRVGTSSPSPPMWEQNPAALLDVVKGPSPLGYTT